MLYILYIHIIHFIKEQDKKQKKKCLLTEPCEIKCNFLPKIFSDVVQRLILIPL